VIVHCPLCAEDFESTALLVEPGMTGAVRCPKCQERVRISSPYGGRVAVVSLLAAWVILADLHVRTILGFAVGTILIWVPVSLLLNAASVRVKGPVLKKWKPRRRTFLEWLYDRDAPPELFNKHRR